MAKTITQQMREDAKSWAEASDPNTVRYCEECGEECKSGQMLWNGWFAYEGLYHFKCMPDHLRERYVKQSIPQNPA